MIQFLLCFCASVAILAPPLAAQTVELSRRTFLVGDRPRTMDVYPPFLAVREIDWIEAILGIDPVLRDAVVHIEESSRSVAEFVAKPDEDYILLGPDRLHPQFNLSDYQIYGPAVATATSFTYVPNNLGAEFFVRCSLRDDVEHLQLCVVYATYAPDDRIRLKARLYFPPDPVDAPTYFRDVAERMRDVAYCLDVTDELIEVPVVHPTLSGCRTEPIS